MYWWCSLTCLGRLEAPVGVLSSLSIRSRRVTHCDVLRARQRGGLDATLWMKPRVAQDWCCSRPSWLQNLSDKWDTANIISFISTKGTHSSVYEMELNLLCIDSQISRNWWCYRKTAMQTYWQLTHAGRVIAFWYNAGMLLIGPFGTKDNSFSRKWIWECLCKLASILS